MDRHRNTVRIVMPAKASYSRKRKWMESLRAALLLAVVVVIYGNVQTGNAQEQATVIVKVEFAGNRRVPVDRIIRYVKTRSGQAYSHEQIYDDLARLAESRLFENVRVQFEQKPAGMVVTFVVSEYPNVVQEVIYRNAHH